MAKELALYHAQNHQSGIEFQSSQVLHGVKLVSGGLEARLTLPVFLEYKLSLVIVVVILSSPSILSSLSFILRHVDRGQLAEMVSEVLRRGCLETSTTGNEGLKISGRPASKEKDKWSQDRGRGEVFEYSEICTTCIRGRRVSFKN